MREAVLAVDLGTSGVKAAVVALDGELAGFAERPYDLIQGDDPACVEQDAVRWWTASRDAMRDAAAAARGVRIVGASIGGQGPSLVPVDESGLPLHNAIIWMDRRAEPERRALSERAGSEVSVYSNVPKAMWLRLHRPDVYAKTRWFLQSWDYIAYRLTGVAVASSFAGATVFPRELLAAADLDPAKFPGEHLMGTPVGTIGEDAASDLGTAAFVVAGGVNDSTATVIGGGLVRRGLALDLGGTSGGISLAWDRPLNADGLTAWPAPTPGLFVCGGPLATAGRALLWFMAVAGFAPGDYAGVEGEAARTPAGAEGLVFLPYLAGERTPLWDDNARGVFFGLRDGHSRGHLARAVFEGVAFGMRHVVDVLREQGGAIEELRVMGGQAKVKLWNQVKADVLGVPVSVPTVTEGAVMGEAVLAVAGAGRASDVASAASRFLKEAARFEPDPATAPVYEARYRTYRELYPRLKDLMRSGGE
ncbi:MAG TPA: FGGY-family carbohydrate kinase [Candidatus Limnocylindria bacterium]